MIEKVLIAEDHESANLSVQKTLEELNIEDVHYSYYCDDALARIQFQKQSNQAYDLLITDLSFEEDQHKQTLKDGFELILAARQIQPEIKILVFSAENKAAIIDTLYNNYKIDAFVRKARNDTKELKLAMTALGQNLRFQPRHLIQAIQQNNSHDFTEYDVTIITLLSQGMLQKDIPEYLQKNHIKPSGLSSIEKRLNHIKDVLQFSKNEQLVAFCKDMGII